MYEKFPDDTIRRVVITNSDTNAGTEFWVATKQLEHLAQLASEVRNTPEPWGEGVDSAAILGMGVIFDAIPQKFPVQNLLSWLRDEINPRFQMSKIHLEATELSTVVVETALIQLARFYVLK